MAAGSHGHRGHCVSSEEKVPHACTRMWGCLLPLAFSVGSKASLNCRSKQIPWATAAWSLPARAVFTCKARVHVSQYVRVRVNSSVCPGLTGLKRGKMRFISVYKHLSVKMLYVQEMLNGHTSSSAVS